MKDEWQPLVAACLIALCVAIGIGVGISPHSPWVPYDVTINDEWAKHDKQGKKPSGEDNPSRSATAPQQFKGALSANPNRCYEDEKEGECAARIVQEGISGFYFWLTTAAVASAIAAGFTGAAVFRQARISRQQTAILDRQAGIMQVQADLEIPRLFCEIRAQNFVEVTGSFAAKLYTTHDTVTMTAPPKVTFRLRNFGRSPAILRFINAKVERKQTAPSEDTSYALIDLPPERVLGRDDVTSDVPAGMSIFKATLKRSEYDMLLRGQTYWWFFGSIGFDDVWGGQNVFHFCWRYDQGVRVFDPYPAERNYTDQIKTKPHGAPAPPQP